MNKKNTYARKDVCGYILKVLQNLGGTATKQDIKEGMVSDTTIDISYEDVFVPVTSKKKGTEYVPFNFDFNFGLKNLLTSGYIEEYSRNGDIILTEKGRSIVWTQWPTPEDKSKIDSYWETKHKEWNERKSVSKPEAEEESNASILIEEEEDGTLPFYPEQWKIDILNQIKLFSPKKFESFSRLLLQKMGVKVDAEKGVKMSGDHGIDGYGTFESDEFRTQKVVVQCKRFTDSPVSEPDIDKFKGVMMSFSADYGIFITTSYFTPQAKEKAIKGSNTVTLIDGQRLVDLIEKYKLHISPVMTYELDSYYYEKD